MMRLSCWVSWWSSLALVLLTGVEVNTQVTCQGYFCDKYLDTMFIVMAHNSFAVAPEVFVPSQNYREPQQFEDGIRAFSMDLYDDDGPDLYMKHGASPGQVDYETRVGEILTVMQGNPHEFILIQLEDHISPSSVGQACSPWGDKLIKNFNPNKNLGYYLSRGQQVLLMTNVNSNVNAALGMHNANNLLSENDYEWTSMDGPPPMGYRRGPKGGTGKYARMMNYFCTEAPFNRGSEAYSAAVNTETRMLCHARQFLDQFPYAGGQINIIMVDFYDLPNYEVFAAQDAIRNGELANQDGTDCVPGTNQCLESSTPCWPLDTCEQCCYGTECVLLIFNCRCK